MVCPLVVTWTLAVSAPESPGRHAVAVTVMGPSRAVTSPPLGARPVPDGPVRSRGSPASVHPAACAAAGVCGPEPGQAHRVIPVWPREQRPGWGHTHSPCGCSPTGIVASRRPVTVDIA